MKIGHGCVRQIDSLCLGKVIRNNNLCQNNRLRDYQIGTGNEYSSYLIRNQCVRN